MVGAAGGWRNIEVQDVEGGASDSSGDALDFSGGNHCRATKSRVCYYKGDISKTFLRGGCQKLAVDNRDEIFLRSLCQKVALGVDKEDEQSILNPN